MPFQDARTLGTPQGPSRAKRKLGSRDAPPVEAEQLLAELVAETVQTVAGVLGSGGAIQFGSTRDRSAVLVRAWLFGDVYEDYVHTVAELVATLEALNDVVEAGKARDPRPFR